ncbi:MAG: hypothetical protein WC773_04795, partial [Patescibacteria group bacterium]
TATTATTTITSLSRSTTYYVKIFAVDTYGNESTLSSISARTTKKGSSSSSSTSTGGGGTSAQVKDFTVTQKNFPTATIIKAHEATTFSWVSTGVTYFVNLWYSLDGGKNYTKIDGPVVNFGYYDWITPSKLSGTKIIFKLELTDLAGVLDTETYEKSLSTTIIPSQAYSPVTGELEEVTEVEFGDYIKSPYFSTIYFVTENLERRPFLNEQTYFTWKDSFDDIKQVTDATLTTLPLMGPILPKPGVKLVKIQSDARVFEVIENPDDYYRPILRWVPDETTAIERFGAEWAKNVLDLPVTIFTRFIMEE